jgi:hypothetical protein
VFRRRKPAPGPPGEAAVVDRLLCVSAIAMLGAIATAVAEREMDDAAAERYLVEARRWLIREGVSGALGAGEKAMLAKPLAEWTAEELETATLRNEAVGVLLWAVAGVEELRPPDTPFERLPADVPLLAATAGFRAAARLRPLGEIEAARAATVLQAPSSRGPGGDEQTGATADLGTPDEERRLEAPRRTAVSDTAAEREHALAWLTGRSADWDAPAAAAG